MRCAIICGGLGTRLGQHAGVLPKVLAPFGGRPLLDHLIEVAVAAGIRDFLLLTGHLSHLVEEYAEFCSARDVRIEVVREHKPLGTAGAIKAIATRLGRDDNVLILYGDIMISADLGRMIDYHLCADAWATLAVHPSDHPYDSDLLTVDGSGRIDAFYPKPRAADVCLPNLVNAGAYVLSSVLLEQIPEGRCDFGKDVFPRLIPTGKIFGYRTVEYFKDIGTPERYDRVRRDYNAGLVARAHRSHARRAVFLDRDGVLNRDTDGVRSADEFEMLPRVAEAVRRINEAGWLAVVVTNQPVLAKGWTSSNELDRIHHKMETLLGREGAYLDAIYFCPHHPDRGFPGEVAELKIPCQCRKPAPGLLYAAARDLNIDLSSSVFIGDSDRDFACARAAGVRPIAVGESWRRAEWAPALRFADLYDAVDGLFRDKGGVGAALMHPAPERSYNISSARQFT